MGSQQDERSSREWVVHAADLFSWHDGRAADPPDGPASPPAEGVAEDHRAPAAGLADTLTAVCSRLSAGDYSLLGDEDLLGAFTAIEHAARMLTGTGYELLSRMRLRDTGRSVAGMPLVDLLAERVHLSTRDVRRRLRASGDLAPTTPVVGDRLPARREPTAAALREGRIGVEHTEVIRRFFDHLPAHVDDATRAHAEDQLVALARAAGPEQVATAARRLTAILDPDGSDEKDRVRRRREYFHLSAQGPDGLSSGRFCVDAELRSYLEVVFAALARNGRCDPDNPRGETGDLTGGPEAEADAEPSGGGPTDPGEDDGDRSTTADCGVSGNRADGAGTGSPATGTAAGSGTAAAQPTHDTATHDTATGGTDLGYIDTRTQDQRNADAIRAALRALLSSGTLGSHRGLPVRVVVTAQLADLEHACGFGVTGGGTLIPMRQVLRMASHAYHYLSVFDDAGRPIYLGRGKRIASPDQRLVLYAGEGGCTFPGCTNPAYYSQVHHLDEWSAGGATDIDTLTLACERHHRRVGEGPGKWATTRCGPGSPSPGRVLWHPPAEVDPLRRGRINHYHHPGEYLTGDQSCRYPTLQQQHRWRRPGARAGDEAPQSAAAAHPAGGGRTTGHRTGCSRESGGDSGGGDSGRQPHTAR